MDAPSEDKVGIDISYAYLLCSLAQKSNLYHVPDICIHKALKHFRRYFYLFHVAPSFCYIAIYIHLCDHPSHSISALTRNRTQTVTHPSTNPAQCCLTTAVSRELVKLHNTGICWEIFAHNTMLLLI